MFHAYGFNGVIASALAMKSPLAIVANPRDLDDVIATIKKVRPASMPGCAHVVYQLDGASGSQGRQG